MTDNWDEDSIGTKTIYKNPNMKKRFRIQGVRNKWISRYKITNEIEYQIQEFRKSWFFGKKKWMPFGASSYASDNDIVHFDNIEKAKSYLDKLKKYYE